MRTGALGERTFSYTWSFPICPHRVSIDFSVIEALQAELSESHEPRHGLLLGEIANGLTHVDGWMRLPALESAVFGNALPKTPRAIGYYTLRDGSAFILSPSEVAIANEHFQPGSVVLLVERRKKGPAEATFYFWRGDVFVHNLPLPFPFHAGLLSGQTRVAPSSPKPMAPKREKSLAVRTAFLTLVAIAAGVLFAAYFHGGPRRAGAPVDAAAISEAAAWIPTEPRRDLELTWDSQSDAVANATSGMLRIEDGGVTRQMSLDRGELLVGSVLYAPASERIRVELTAIERDGRTARAAVAAKVADLSAPSPLPTPPVAPPKGDLVAEATKVAPLTKNDPAPKQTERRPAKRFVWTTADRAGTSQAPAVDNLPQAAPPVESPNLVAANLPPAVLPAPTLPAAPPPKAPTPAPKPAIPHSGRLIWTGNLPRRGIVELDGRSVSIGSLTGALPGVPVNIAITPAEFDESGLLIFTNDAKRHNHVEPPSAANGWNRMTYVWDPDRMKQLAILEYPNQSNNYSRLTLRNDARRCSMIFIDWTVR